MFWDTVVAYAPRLSDAWCNNHLAMIVGDDPVHNSKGSLKMFITLLRQPPLISPDDGRMEPVVVNLDLRGKFKSLLVDMEHLYKWCDAFTSPADGSSPISRIQDPGPVSYTHLRAHET